MALLVRAADLDRARPLARMHARMVTDERLSVPVRTGTVRARAYWPAGGVRRLVVLITGVHPAGIDEPRLVHFARSMAAAGLGVITPDMERLIRFEITPDATDLIEDVAHWAAEHPAAGPDRRVGLAGISFSGGLATVAAGRPRLRDRTAFVLSVGGHGDLLRTLETLGGDALREDGQGRSDAFGLALVLTAVAQHVVPAAQVEGLRTWARTFLDAAHLPPGDPVREAGFARADRLAKELSDPAATLVRHAMAGDAAALRPHLLALVRELAGDPALSPERAPPPAAPVYLLHGTGDPVIPPEESRRLAAHLAPHTHVQLLITPALTHADVVEELSAGELWRLVRFLASLLRQ